MDLRDTEFPRLLRKERSGFRAIAAIATLLLIVNLTRVATGDLLELVDVVAWAATAIAMALMSREKKKQLNLLNA